MGKQGTMHIEIYLKHWYCCMCLCLEFSALTEMVTNGSPPSTLIVSIRDIKARHDNAVARYDAYLIRRASMTVVSTQLTLHPYGDYVSFKVS